MTRAETGSWFARLVWISLIVGLATAGCREVSGRLDQLDARVGIDARPADARLDAVDSTDGPPTRLPCTDNFGAALTTDYGRLDGILVSIVPPGTPGCNSDSGHVHLQVRIDGSIYDVAVNVDDDVLTATRDVAVDTTPWAEGWHTTLRFSYPSINVHAGDFTDATPPELVAALLGELETVNHISIYSTAYGGSGTHLVHRNTTGRDGAIVTRPLSHPPRVRMYRFVNQTF